MVKPPLSALFPIKDQADLTLALIKTAESGLLAGATDHDKSVVKTIFSELGTNIIKYAKRGQLFIQRIEAGDTVDIQIEATDFGPGIVDIKLALQDQYSTGKSLGLGLPSVRRMADEFSIKSKVNQGTTIHARKRILQPAHSRYPTQGHSSSPAFTSSMSRRTTLVRNNLFEAAHCVRPPATEHVCGDMATIIETPDGVLLALADASGHGPRASAIASDIGTHLALNAGRDLKRLMTDLHETLRGTLGAAVALVHVDKSAATANFCGVGNTRASRVVGKTWHPISKDGVLGHRLPTLGDQTTHLENGDLILMWTDGLSELSSRNYAAEHFHFPSDRLAHELIKSLGRPFDDAGCLVFKWIA